MSTQADPPVTNTSQVLGELITEYFASSRKMDRDCRLLVPGLTRRIAREIHDHLRGEEVNSYLVVGESCDPSEDERTIRAIALTSRRIGSFVAIAEPGELVNIQDSIRGSGGTIRTPAFSDEWPWIDNGSEPFQFDGPFLKSLVRRWSDDTCERDWLEEFVLRGLLEHTRASSRRADILLESILGTFHPSLYPDVGGIPERFLRHAGIPRPTTLQRPGDAIARSDDLCRQILGRRRQDEDVRGQAHDRVQELFDPGEQGEVTELLDQFLDRLGSSETLDLGMLAFHECWSNSEQWSRLDADLLAKLFSVQERTKAKITSVAPTCQRGVIDDHGRKLATFVGEDILFDIEYEVPEANFQGAWFLQVLNRRRVVVQQQLGAPSGQTRLRFNTANAGGRLSRKIPLRLALTQDNVVQSEERVSLDLCGEERPALAIVERGFEVVDAGPVTGEESSDKRVETGEPAHVFLLAHDCQEEEVRFRDQNDQDVDRINLVPGIWRSSQRVDPGRHAGQAVIACFVGDLSAVVCLEEAIDVEKGQFTLEDELRTSIIEGRNRDVREMLSIFGGSRREPYARLGRMDDPGRRRTSLARIVSTRTGWRPVLADLRERGQGASALGDFVLQLGQVNGDAFRSVQLPEKALALLRSYSDARHAVLRTVETHLDGTASHLEHPTYATHPVFVESSSADTDTKLQAYLCAYRHLLDYVETAQQNLEWRQLFVLTHLDCVVHWDQGDLRNSFYLVGPWHPLVLSKRFMVQAALYLWAHRLEEGNGQFRRLGTLLGSVQGFRWMAGLSPDDRRVSPAYVSLTGDPGWHLAVKIDCPLLARNSTEELVQVLDRLREILGLTVDLGAGGSTGLVTTSVFSFLRANPSRRSVGIRIRRGYPAEDIVRTVDKKLHPAEGDREFAELLPGGVRLYLEESPRGEMDDVAWASPPLYLYQYETDEICLGETSPDIYMLPPVQGMTFRRDAVPHRVPRARGRLAVFSQSLAWLTEGQALLPMSLCYEFEAESRDGSDSDVGAEFTRTTATIGGLIGDPVLAVRPTKLPERLSAPWVVIPGHSLDPAVLVQYVRDGADRNIQERALWDYRLDLGGGEASYFVLSTVPRGFQVAVNGFFGGYEVADDFLVELGRIGIAVGGEALRSGRHALGIVGLVGAVRLLMGENPTGGPVPLGSIAGRVGFLIPVDSFASFFGQTGSGDRRRTDLLAILLQLPTQSTRLRISAVGVECKFVSRTFGLPRVHEALGQAGATLDDFKSLAVASLQEGAMPERLALLEIIKFGLRITSPSGAEEIEPWIKTEASIYDALLSGNYVYVDGATPAMVVTTEGGLPGAPECRRLEDGVWVRLTKGHWPGVSETTQLNAIREELSDHLGSSLSKHDPPRPSEPPAEIASGIPGQEVRSAEVTLEGPPRAEMKETSPPGDARAKARPTVSTPIHDPGTQPSGNFLRRIRVGVDDARNGVYYDPQSPVDPLDNLNLMVTGSSGTGKTQFLKYLICELRKQEKNTFVLDLKNDFASDEHFCSRAMMERVFAAFDGLPLNPLIPYPVRHPGTGRLYIQCAQHIAGVSSVLARTYGLGAQQQAAVKNAIVSAFSGAGITTTGSVPFTTDLAFPSLADVGDALREDSPTAYNRLDPLFTLDLFREAFRHQSFEDMVGQATVLDLSQIPSDEIKNALAQLLVLSAHSFYNTQPHSGLIRQFLVFDEAHRVLNSDYMLRLARECRAYGVGVVLSSQYPSDFPAEVSASMATRIVHGNGGDAERVRAIVQLLGCRGREGDVAALDRFQAFVDNRHHRTTLARTMNYPLYLVWSELAEAREATHDELASVPGIDTTKLPIRNVVRQLEYLGLAEDGEHVVTAVAQA